MNRDTTDAAGNYPSSNWRYFLNNQEISAYEQAMLSHAANLETTLQAILRELRKLNAKKRAAGKN